VLILLAGAGFCFWKFASLYTGGNLNLNTLTNFSSIPGNLYGNISKPNTSISTNFSSDIAEFKLDASYYLSLSVTWLVFAFLILIVLIVVVLVLIFLLRRLRLAIQLIKESSKAIAQMFYTLFFPIIPMFLQLIFLIYFVAVAVVLASSGKSLFKISTSNSTNSSSLNFTALTVGSLCSATNEATKAMCKYYSFGDDPNQAIFSAIGFFYKYQWLPQLFNLFMFFWVQSFIVAMSQMILAGSFATWYWSKAHARCALLVSIKDTFVYHLGSVAFGKYLKKN
jgi:choline transporter-like protein 2/4/5